MTKKHKEGKLANKKELDKRIKLLFLDKKNFYPEQKMEEKKVTKVAECKFTGYLLFQTETPINRDFRWFDFFRPNSF